MPIESPQKLISFCRFKSTQLVHQLNRKSLITRNRKKGHVEAKPGVVGIRCVEFLNELRGEHLNGSSCFSFFLGGDFR